MSLVRAASLVLLPTLTLGAVILSGTAEPLRAAAQSMPKARLAGVMVNHAIDRESDDMPDLAFQSTFARTKFAIVIDNPDGGIIGISREASTIKQFVDDTGKSLVDPDNPFGPFGFGERIVQDGNRVALELESKMAPATGAKFVNAQGSIALRTAHEKSTMTSKTGLFKKGAEFDCDTITFTVISEGTAQWGEGFEIEFETNENIDAIIKYTIIQPDGTEVALEPMSTMTFGTTSRITLNTKQRQATGRLSLEAWTDAKVTQVPFNVSAAVGMR